MISVCIATYNGGQYIKDQLQSILCQLDINDEVIISDDGSTDNTLLIIQELFDTRVKVLNHTKNNIISKSAGHIYASSNFEHALKHARGDYIFLSDQDDIWIESKVRKMLDALKNNILVISNFSIIDSEGEIIECKHFGNSPIYRNLLKNIITMPFYGCCMAFRREVLFLSLPFPNKLLLHDNWIGFIAMNIGKIAYIDEPLLLYRRHSNNVSNAAQKSSNTLLYKVLYRITFYRLLKHRLCK